MIHELIDPKKKKNKTNVSGSTKKIQNSKNIFEYSNFESSYYENKNTEASLATFMPLWLRSSLGLNQRNILSHATTSSDQKPSKIIQKSKGESQNEFDALKQNIEHSCCKNWKHQDDLVPKESPQETIHSPDNAETVIINGERITASQNIKSKVFESKSSEDKFLGKGDWVKADANALLPEETEKLKGEDTKKAKLIKQKNSYKKRISSDQKSYNLDKSDLDYFLQMKAREVVENLKKKELHSGSPETRNLDTKLLVLGAKPHDSNNYKLKQQDIRWLQEMKSQIMSTDDFEGLFEHLTEMNLKDFAKNQELLSENVTERKREEKDDRKDKNNARESLQKCEYDERLNEDEGLLLSSDDEDNIKRFSQFLSKNEDLEEKKKCLEEVRSYFEKKRKLRLSKRCFFNEEEKKKANLKPNRKEESIKEKSRAKNSYKGMKSKFGICDEEMVEKAVEDTLQKFIESHHINASPATLETVKRSIFHCMSGNYSKSNRSPPVMKKYNLDQLGLGERDLEKLNFSSCLEGIEVSGKEPVPYKESKKKNGRAVTENSGDLKETNVAENEKFKRLRKEFDNFLHSVQFHIDFTNLKLQSVILEKEEQTSASKNVQFVYNFTKKSLEQGKMAASGNKHCNDNGTQTAYENEVAKRNVKVQAFEYKSTCEQSLQTEIMSGVTEATQTNDDQVSLREIKELKSYDVNPGLYRMVKSKEPGKFYLYPEPEDRKQSTNFSLVTNKRFNRKKDFLNVLSKSSSKDKRYFLKERDRAKLKRIKKLGKALVRLEGVSSKQGKSTEVKTDSLSCLYFRNLDQSHSGLFTPNKEMTLTENTMVRTDDSEDLRLGDAEQIPSGDHLGCFWFWNGEKISAGCDLKTHVENLLKEKLREMVCHDNLNKPLPLRSASMLKRNKKELKKVMKKSAVLHFENVHDSTKEDTLLSDEDPLDERKKAEEEKNQSEETKGVASPLFEEKAVRDVATQNSERTCVSINTSKLKVQKSKIGFPVKKKTNKGHMVLKHRRGKPVNVRKAANIVEAIEELKRMKLEAENSKNGGPRDSDSLLHFSLSTKESKDEADPLPIVFRHQESLEAVDSNLKNRLKQLVSLVNCENQRNGVFGPEDVNSIPNPQTENHKHIALIETVLNRITNKDRESLWNDVRDFIKTRINRDRNDDDREVCIEIEQDLHKNDRGKLRDILAKGHYRRNEGDIEVEIDLTLDDLERILRQRQKNIRKRTLYRTNLSNKYLSTSSIQSEFTRDDFRRYQKYLESLTSGRGHVQEKEMKSFL